MPDGLHLPLLMTIEVGVMAFLCAAVVWTLRRWFRRPLWQPRRVTQELVLVLFLLVFGGQILYLALAVTLGGCPLHFEQGAGLGHKAVLILLLLLGQGSALLCFAWLGLSVLLVACYAFGGQRIRHWCAFGRMARRVAVVTVGLLPLAGVAVLFDHAAWMHWKFDLYGGSSGTSVGVATIALFVAYVLVALCVAYTAGRIYADRLLCLLAFLPALVLLLFWGGVAGGLFYVVFR